LRGESHCNDNFKILKKEIKEDTRRWKDVPCSWITRINIRKMAMLPKALYKFNAMFIKIPMTFLTGIIIPKYIWKQK
jgi:hypothetical protein